MHTQANTSQTIGTQVMAALKQHMAAHRTNDKDWPVDAEFAVVSRCSTWPCGWCKSSDTTFFTSRQEMEKWMADQREWAKCEDNYIAWIAYEWDLGPNRLPEYDRDAGNV